MVSESSGRAWPVAEGRYEVGNPESSVAICTMSSVGMKFPMDRVAIAGKCVTENLGVEKMVKNLASNPKIRYLVMCGRESMGHFVDNAIECLIENGVDEEGRIIGAKGGIPVLKNVSRDDIERFRKQIKVINMAGETDVNKVMERVGELLDGSGEQGKKGPGFPDDRGPESGERPDSSGEETGEPGSVSVPVHPVGEWVQDPKGYFTIMVSYEGNEIIAEHHDNDGRITKVLAGKRAEDLYHHIINTGIVSRLDHAAYLGRELAKAETALINRLDYEQDSPLKCPALEERTGSGHGGDERSLTYMGAGVKEFVFRQPVSREEERFKKLLVSVGLCRIF